MKRKSMALISAAALLLSSGAGLCGESSVELGKKLFNDPTLSGSTNDKSCNSCHADGKGLENAGAKENLSDIINQCVTGPLGGQKIDGRTVEMRSLKMYIQSLGKGE